VQEHLPRSPNARKDSTVRGVLRRGPSSHSMRSPIRTRAVHDIDHVQGVPHGPRHDLRAATHAPLAHRVQPRHATFGTEVLAVAAGEPGRHRDHETHQPVHGMGAAALIPRPSGTFAAIGCPRPGIHGVWQRLMVGEIALPPVGDAPQRQFARTPTPPASPGPARISPSRPSTSSGAQTLKNGCRRSRPSQSGCNAASAQEHHAHV